MATSTVISNNKSLRHEVQFQAHTHNNHVNNSYINTAATAGLTSGSGCSSSSATNNSSNHHHHHHRGKQYCNNCGKYGHINKICKEPITSLGIVCIKIEGCDTVNLLSSIIGEKSVNMLKYNSKSNRHLSKVNEYNDRVKFLLIQRKHSLGFLEFMRGRYEPTDYKGIIRLFELMSELEIASLRDDDFESIWTRVWRKTAHLKLYEEEYVMSKTKFMALKHSDGSTGILPLSFYVTNIGPKYKTPEWGFPKGRRAHHEKNYDCATREFEEETNYSKEDYCVLENVLPVKEVFYGTNSVLYKHIYYVGLLMNGNKTPGIEKNNNEIGDIGWFTYAEATELIRCYHSEKKKVLNEIFKYTVCAIESSKQRAQQDTFVYRHPLPLLQNAAYCPATPSPSKGRGSVSEPGATTSSKDGGDDAENVS